MAKYGQTRPSTTTLYIQPSSSSSTLMATTRRLMKAAIQDVLDDITSVNAPSSRRTRGLAVLEQQLALACASKIGEDTMNVFLELQDTFECNVSSRAVSWIQTVTPHIEALGSGKSSGNKEREAELHTICAQLYQLLSIVQGVVLHHEPSKAFLGRRYSLEILTALLTISRHTPMINHEAGAENPITPVSHDKSSSIAHLSSAVLDSLLCILVDSSPALRIFEEVNGVQAVVKILKRAGTPREVRMKCLEFLYFYLMDESGSPGSLSTTSTSQSTPSSPTSTQPNTPGTPRPKIFPRPPSGLSNLSFVSASSSSSSSSSRLITSSSSFTAMSSLPTTSAHTSDNSIHVPSPIKKSYSTSAVPNDPQTPPNSPPPATNVPEGTQRGIQSYSMLMLQKDVEYEPQSPKKVQVSRLGVAHGRSASRLRERATGSSDHGGETSSSFRAESASNSEAGNKEIGGVRTTSEKKEILGTMLGNVDALVEGVRKAGIWGLS
ncbi:cell division control protein 14, SIN component-domain-containing protein [Pisolithus croceorrhizus]|nr:cell division control protein 14, SIN component-domain-containing protein [Pisolithus croceorrhizus]